MNEMTKSQEEFQEGANSRAWVTKANPYLCPGSSLSLWDRRLPRVRSLTRLRRERGWRRCGWVVLELDYRFQQDTINIREQTEAVRMFSVRKGLESLAPPRHENNEGRYACGPPKPNARYFARRADLRPPFLDLQTKGVDLHTVVPSVIMSILEKYGDDGWAMDYRKSCRGLDIVSAL